MTVVPEISEVESPPEGPIVPTEPAETSVDVHVTIIEARKGWQLLDLNELWQYRDLFRFLVWRDIKGMYAQSAIGIGWAVIQPLSQMLVFTIVFGQLVQAPSDGKPYGIFNLVALIPWTYFSMALTSSTASLVSNANMLSKVYFPRILLPLTSVVSKLVDFAIALVIVLIPMLIIYGEKPNWGVLMLPYLTLLMVVSTAGLGAWLTAAAIQYRDVKHAVNFLIRMLMYAAPVVYPTSKIPTNWEAADGVYLNLQHIYAINPMVGVIEGFRSALLNTQPMPWDLIGIGTLTTIIVTVTGLIYFRSKERLFADVA